MVLRIDFFRLARMVWRYLWFVSVLDVFVSNCSYPCRVVVLVLVQAHVLVLGGLETHDFFSIFLVLIALHT